MVAMVLTVRETVYRSRHLILFISIFVN